MDRHPWNCNSFQVFFPQNIFQDYIPPLYGHEMLSRVRLRCINAVRVGLQTSRQFPEVSRKVSRNLESFHSKVSGKFPEKFGNSEKKKFERNKDMYAYIY